MFGITTKAQGDDGEARAWEHLRARGLVLVQRNYRVAAGPRVRGGEIDLIARDRDGTLVFIEVRSRADGRFGGAAGSISAAKQRSLVLAAQHYLMTWRGPLPVCRFDVIAFDAGSIVWIRDAFRADTS